MYQTHFQYERGARNCIQQSYYQLSVLHPLPLTSNITFGDTIFLIKYYKILFKFFMFFYR